MSRRGLLSVRKAAEPARVRIFRLIQSWASVRAIRALPASTLILLYFLAIATGRLSMPLGVIGAGAFLSFTLLARFGLDGIWSVLFFAGSFLIIFGQREKLGIDMMVLVSVVAVGFVWINIQLASRVKDPRSAWTSSEAGPVAVLALTGFLLVCLITTTINGFSLSLVPWVVGSLVCLTLLSAPTEKVPTFESVRRILTVSLLTTSIYDLALLLSGRGEAYMDVGRYGGSLNSYELIAEYYGFAIFLAVANLVVEKNKWFVLLSFILSGSSVFLLLATVTRGPLLLLTVLVPLFLISLSISSRIFRKRIMGVAAGLAVLVVLSVGVFATSDVFGRLTKTTAASDGDFASLINRGGVWNYFTGLNGFQNVGLFGHGFEYPYQALGTYPHSLYLWLIWTTGYLGLFLFALFIVGVVRAAIRARIGNRIDLLIAGFLLLFLFLDEVKIEAARTSATVAFLWIAISFLIVATRRSSRKT